LARKIAELANEARQVSNRCFSDLSLGEGSIGGVNVSPEFTAQHKRLTLGSGTGDHSGVEQPSVKMDPSGWQGLGSRDMDACRESAAKSGSKRAKLAEDPPTHNRDECHQRCHADGTDEQCDITRTCHCCLPTHVGIDVRYTSPRLSLARRGSSAASARAHSSSTDQALGPSTRPPPSR